jgi:hypothetical protein
MICILVKKILNNFQLNFLQKNTKIIKIRKSYGTVRNRVRFDSFTHVYAYFSFNFISGMKRWRKRNMLLQSNACFDFEF